MEHECVYKVITYLFGFAIMFFSAIGIGLALSNKDRRDRFKAAVKKFFADIRADLHDSFSDKT